MQHMNDVRENRRKRHAKHLVASAAPGHHHDVLQVQSPRNAPVSALSAFHELAQCVRI